MPTHFPHRTRTGLSRLLHCSAVASCLLAPLGALAADAAPARSNVQQLYLQAEQEKDPYAAAAKWQEVLKGDVDSLGKGVTRETLQINLVQSLMAAGVQANHPEAFTEAMQQAGKLNDPNSRVWALVAIAREATRQHRQDVASEARETASKLLISLPTAEAKSAAAYGMVSTLMKGGKEYAPEAKKWLDYISDGSQHALALQRIAAAEHDGKDATALTDEAESALDDDKLQEALEKALALPFEPKEARQKLLLSIYKKAKSDDQFTLALKAISGMETDDTQTEPMLGWAEELIKDGEQAEAAEVAAAIPEGGDQARAWGMLAKYFKEEKQTDRLQHASEQMMAAAERVKESGRKEDIFAEVAKTLAETGNPKLAETAISKAGKSEKRFKALAAIVKSMATAGMAEDAVKYLDKLEDAPKDMQADAVGGVAKALAKQGKLDEAKDVLDDHDELEGDAIDKARDELTKQLAKQKKISDAGDFSDAIKTPSLKRHAQAMVFVAEFAEGKKKHATDGITQLLDKVKDSEQDLAMLLPQAAKIGMVDITLAHYRAMKDPAARWKVASALIDAYMANHEKEKAVQFVLGIHDELQDKALARVAIEHAQIHEVLEASQLARYIDDVHLRVRTYRHIAEIQARYTDFYGMLNDGNEKVSLQVDGTRAIVSPSVLPADRPSPQEVNAFERSIVTLQKERTTPMLMTKMMPSAVGRYIPKPVRLKRLLLDETYIRGKLPAARLPMRYSIIDYRFSPYNEKFVDTLGSAGFDAAQGSSTPNAVYIQSGQADLRTLYDQLRADGHMDYILKNGGVYTLRIPIIVGPQAAFTIEGPTVKELRMSTEKRSYIVNAGQLFILGTRVVGWREKEGELATATYAEKYNFRPYITSWSRSRTYIAGSEFVSLGYSGSKSYGISITSGPKLLVKNQIDEAKRPRAVIVENSFRNMLYGFYSYEADHVVLVGNEYIKNITYGIDPHDRSRWFTIAYNTAYDTDKKHGIIISREVNFSTILGNISFNNAGSGIMIDRQSSGTLIYANSAFINHHDGLTIFESNCKIIASNRFFRNGSSGIRVRNSTDVSVFFNVLQKNNSAGIYGYTADLRKDPAHQHRDFTLDPFSDVVAFNAIGNWVESNGVGINVDNISAMLMKENQFVNQSPKLLRGAWTRDIPDLLTKYDMKNDGTFITKRCPTATLAKREPCSFRAEGYYRGDGQGNLIDRILNPQCPAPAQKAEKKS